MPGYLKKFQVPPKLSLLSRIKKLALGLYFLRWQAALIPEIPAPITIVS
jgi:hypothetical protein